MSPKPQKQDASWRALYLIGAVAALTAVILFRRNFGAEMMISNGFGLFDVPQEAPTTALGWFSLFQDNWFVGLALFNMFDLINYVLVGLIFLALYGALKQVNKSLMVLAMALTIVGSTVFLATNQAFSMLSLSHRYTEAATDAQQAMFLAAGEALLAIDNPGVLYEGFGYLLGLFFVLLAGLLISIMMLRSPIFHKAAAYTGILANSFGLAYFLTLFVAPTIIWLPPTLSAPFRVIWYVLIAIKLFQLARNKSQEKSNHEYT